MTAFESAPFARKAAAYLWKRKVFLCPQCRATNGHWIETEPLIVIDEGDGRFGGQILEVLAQSSDDVSPFERRGHWVSPSLKTAIVAAAGVDCYEAFISLTFGGLRWLPYAGIWVVADEVVFTPDWLGTHPGDGGLLSNKPSYTRKRGVIRSRMIESEMAAMLIAAFGAYSAWPP